MPFGKAIRIFLIDGDPSGRMTCDLSNWTGRAYKVPRSLIKSLHDREELIDKACIYLLFGKDDDGEDLAYIGETEDIFNRLKKHLSEKEFWNETIVFFSKDEQLNKAHIKYIENRLCSIASKISRYRLYNGNEPKQSVLSEADRAEMEEFIENVKLLVNTLGHKIFEEKRKIVVALPENERGDNIEQAEIRNSLSEDVIFSIKTKGIEAFGRPTTDGFVVFSQSGVVKEWVPSAPIASIPKPVENSG